MNWKLVLQLSLFGLVMAIATVFVIPSTIEPFCWLAIFIACAYVIARRGVPRPFLHGLAIGVMNSVWVTAAHVIFVTQYLANHAREAAMMSGSAASPRMMMTITGPVVGLVSGIVLGLFALLAVKLMHRDARPATT
jgi:hypothetical protein